MLTNLNKKCTLRFQMLVTKHIVCYHTREQPKVITLHARISYNISHEDGEMFYLSEEYLYRR